jgi:phosphoribosyl 1,2-cyclic phosphodiesterase
VRATIWGCRGSVPTPGPETIGYGGNTSCLGVELADGLLLVFDAGTGIRALGEKLESASTNRIHVLLTHLHLDHLEGLRFFAPMWDDRFQLDIWGPPSPLLGLRERIARAFSPPLFPVDLSDVPARLTFHDTPREPWRIGEALLRAGPVVHPGPTVGYRVECNGASLAYIPDHEPALAGSIAGRSPDWLSGAALAAAADVVLHDAQYTEAEYAERVGWGHSSVADAVAFGRAVEARRLVLFHHDPSHSDRRLEDLEAHARALAGANGGTRPTLAREGMVLEVA